MILFVLLVTVTPPQAVHLLVRKVDHFQSGAGCQPRTNHFSGSQFVERERTGSRLSTGTQNVLVEKGYERLKVEPKGERP